MECKSEQRETAMKQQRVASSKDSQLPRKQCMETRVCGDRELVKHMSKLPRYLKRTETPQDKLLNVGVLNWRHLEKWQNSHKKMSSLMHNDASSSSSPTEESPACSNSNAKLAQKEAKSHINSSKSMDDPRAQRVPKAKVGINGCKSVSVDDLVHEKRIHSSSMAVQARFRVTVKNSQPLFTFEVNKESDILAATLKKPNGCNGVYTFFSIKEEHLKKKKKKKGEIHQNGIISNVVAQLRVSTSEPSGSIREFVLFSTDLGHELAAIIIKIPRRVHKQSLDVINTTVLLQIGVHSLPHKDRGVGPSSLIQRWRSGGSCDCGGWDVGCNLTVLSNQCKTATSSNSMPTSDRTQLFIRGGKSDEEELFLSVVRLKEEIYAVTYSSSLSLLQAFSICIAVAESREVLETLQLQRSYNGMVEEDDEVLPRYATCPPPLSPAGRV